LLAKVIGCGATRELAIGRALVGVRALELEGVPTNGPLLERARQHEAFLAGEVDTGFFRRVLS
jgi:biotin carboxylase